MIRALRCRLLGGASLVLAAGTGCTELAPPPASLPTVTQIIQLDPGHVSDALSGASAYSMITLIAVRHTGNDFDFVFDVGPDSVFGLGTTGNRIAVLLPRGALALEQDAGLQWTPLDFDSIHAAPAGGYRYDRPTVIRTGDVVIAASRQLTCTTGLVSPRYAKLFIESIDPAAESARIVVTINPNCGYRSLEPGIPTF